MLIPYNIQFYYTLGFENFLIDYINENTEAVIIPVEKTKPLVENNVKEISKEEQLFIDLIQEIKVLNEKLSKLL